MNNLATDTEDLADHARPISELRGIIKDMAKKTLAEEV